MEYRTLSVLGAKGNDVSEFCRRKGVGGKGEGREKGEVRLVPALPNALGPFDLWPKMSAWRFIREKRKRVERVRVRKGKKIIGSTSPACMHRERKERKIQR